MWWNFVPFAAEARTGRTANTKDFTANAETHEGDCGTHCRTTPQSHFRLSTPHMATHVLSSVPSCTQRRLGHQALVRKVSGFKTETAADQHPTLFTIASATMTKMPVLVSFGHVKERGARTTPSPSCSFSWIYADLGQVFPKLGSCEKQFRQLVTICKAALGFDGAQERCFSNELWLPAA